MKLTRAFLSCLLLAQSCSAFVLRPTVSTKSLPSAMFMAVELEPEPEGGEELTTGTTMPETRVKKMKELPDIKSDDGIACQFWMKSQADGALIKEVRTQILKDASKKANFPGFRKGQVPPYAQPQITQFSVQESIIKTVEAVMDAYGLKSLPGSDGELDVNENVDEMSKGYKIGDPLQFTATLNAVIDPEKQQPAAASDSDVVEVEAEETA